jgi:hypothetical protein
MSHTCYDLVQKLAHDHHLNEGDHCEDFAQPRLTLSLIQSQLYASTLVLNWFLISIELECCHTLHETFQTSMFESSVECGLTPDYCRCGAERNMYRVHKIKRTSAWWHVRTTLKISLPVFPSP